MRSHGLRLTGHGIVRGWESVRAYFAAGLAIYRDLQFRLLDVLICVESVTLYYISVEKRVVAEVMFLDGEGKVSKALAHYDV